MRNLNKDFISIFLLFFVIFSTSRELFSEEVSYSHALVTTPSGIKIKVEVADTFSKRRLGLGKRVSLKKNWGMLFVFDKIEKHRFWMKNMNFPLDIIWLENHRIVHIHENAMPIKTGQILSILEPIAPANFVLEIAAGRVNQLKLRNGDFLSYEFF